MLVDCWNGSNNEPIVKHGYTFTSKIPFHSVLQVIKEYAFASTEFPLIISLEVHCNYKQQRKMAQYLKATFGDMLVNATDLKTVTPEKYRHKIFLQGEVARIKNVTISEYDPITDTFTGGKVAHEVRQQQVAEKTQMYEGKMGQWSQDLYELISFRSVPFRQAQQAANEEAYVHVNMSETSAFSKINQYPEMFKEQKNENILTRICKSLLKLSFCFRSQRHPL